MLTLAQRAALIAQERAEKDDEVSDGSSCSDDYELTVTSDIMLEALHQFGLPTSTLMSAAKVLENLPSEEMDVCVLCVHYPHVPLADQHLSRCEQLPEHLLAENKEEINCDTDVNSEVVNELLLEDE